MKVNLGDLYSFRLLGGGYGVAQILATDHFAGADRVLLAPLDFYSAIPPMLSMVEGSSLCPQQTGRKNHGIEWVERTVPWWASFIGNDRPRLLPMIPEKGYTGWGSAPRALHDLRLDRSGRKTYDNGPRERGTIPVNLGGTTGTYKSGFDYGIETFPLMPADGLSVDWSALDGLPGLVALDHRGADRGLSAWLSTKTRINALTWREPEDAAIDLSATSLLYLSFADIDRPVTVSLPDSVIGLTLSGSTGQVTLKGPSFAEPFRLTLEGPNFAGIPQGLEDLRVIEFAKFQTLDLTSVSSLPYLAEIVIRDVPGGIANIGALAALPELRHFSGIEIYGFDAKAFPAPPQASSLLEVYFSGLSTGDAKVLRRRLADVPTVSFDRVRSVAWLAANADNPFRDWEDTYGSVGNGAGKLWRKALAAARKAGAKPTKDDAHAIVKHFISGLNDIHAFVTEDFRDEAWRAVHHLVHASLSDALSPEETSDLIRHLVRAYWKDEVIDDELATLIADLDDF
jgi:hypothetical protein